MLSKYATDGAMIKITKINDCMTDSTSLHHLYYLRNESVITRNMETIREAGQKQKHYCSESPIKQLLRIR